MIFYINNQNGTGYRYPNKESFLDDLSALIDELTKEGATYFDMNFESDAKKFYTVAISRTIREVNE